MLRLRRLFVLGSVLGCWLLVVVGKVEAQCTGYSANVIYTPLAPSDVAARGGVTATTTGQVSKVSGGVPSHNLTVTPGTQVNFSVSSANGVSAVAFYRINGGVWQGQISQPLSGAVGYWTIPNSWVGSTYTRGYQVTDSNGNTTLDIVNVTVVAGSSPSIVSQDELPINGYAQVTINFGGGSMLNNCSECQTGNSQQCINATHTPYVTMTAVNRTSGESQSIARRQAGNIAKSNESVSGSGSIWISVLPGDDVGGTANAEIFCTMFGDLPVSGNDDWGIDWELAWTKFSTIQSTCLPSPPTVGCKVTWKYMCSDASKPPDLQPTIVFAEFDTNGNPVTLETVPPFWWGWGFGIRGHVSMFKTPWIFPANVLQQYKVGDLSSWAHVVLEVAAGSFPSNSTIRKCTNKDAGTSPEVVPPFDQP